ncbi:hypothetical protein P4H32_32340 [Bacillus cereus]|nr:hypothetical protein [Bacillus cereus]
MLQNVIDKVQEIGYDRCGNCPAYWHNIDYWGEAHEGCSLHRDIYEFCHLSLLPQLVMKPYLKFKERQESKYWDRIYQQEMEKWEQEETTERMNTD